MNGQLNEAGQNGLIQHVLIDSRRLHHAHSSLFVAIKTKTNDGHHYIDELIQRGVSNFLISDPNYISENANFVLVKDSKTALQKFAAEHRSRFDLPIIGITGSNGKTIVKEWLHQLLHNRYSIVRSPRSFNSQVGVPLSLLQIADNHNLGIFEAGISEPVEMMALEQMIQPEIGVFTNIGDAHSAGFMSKEQKLNEKLQLFNRSKVLVYSSQQDEVNKAVQSNKSVKHFSWGFKESDTVKILERKIVDNSTEYTLEFISHSFTMQIPFTDNASQENAMHCVAVMLYLGFAPSEIQKSIQTLHPIEMRMFQREGINNCLIIEDYYNTDFHSLELALDFALRQHRGGKFTLVLSDIFQSELPDDELYLKVADLVKSKPVSRLIAVGENLSKHRALFKNLKSLFFQDINDLLEHFQNDWFTDETILMKGARQFSFEKLGRKLSKRLHQTCLEINLNALADNLNFFRSRLDSDTKIMAMVKAHSYGSGSHQVAHLLQSKGLDFLAVAYTQEGVQLRKDGITLPIMVMNPEEGNLDQLLEHDLQANVYSFKILDDLVQTLRTTAHVSANIHLEFNTGMARLGFENSDLDELIGILQKEANLKVVTAFSHLAASDEKAHDEFTKSQCEQFEKIAAQLKSELGDGIIAHILNSAGVISHPEYQMDMIRLGIGLYGVDPSEASTQLSNVYKLKSYISQIRFVAAKESVGYGRSGIVEEDRRIAILPIGYADGWNRLLSNGVGTVRIKGIDVPVVGKICMDMCMVDVTHVHCHEGDEVIFFESQDDIEAIAKATGTIPYEVLTSISERVQRVFVEE